MLLPGTPPLAYKCCVPRVSRPDVRACARKVKTKSSNQARLASGPVIFRFDTLSPEQRSGPLVLSSWAQVRQTGHATTPWDGSSISSARVGVWPVGPRTPLGSICPKDLIKSEGIVPHPSHHAPKPRPSSHIRSMMHPAMPQQACRWPRPPSLRSHSFASRRARMRQKSEDEVVK